VVADSTKVSDPEQARRLGKASLGMSISGIISIIVIVGIVLGAVLGGASSAKSASTSCSYYLISGTC